MSYYKILTTTAIFMAFTAITVLIGCDNDPIVPPDEPWTNPNWDIETVDNDGGSYSSVVIDSSGHPHISYTYRVNYYDDACLKYARWDGGYWHIETVVDNGSTGWYASLALDFSGYPCIAYSNATRSTIEYARWGSSAWQFESVDELSGTPMYTSLALDSSDYPHISYFDYENERLKYAVWDGSGWRVETVDSHDVGRLTSLALDQLDNPHISYSNKTGYGIKYAYWNGAGWVKEHIDTESYTDSGVDIVVDSSGVPHLAYGRGGLKHAYQDSSGWHIETVDNNALVCSGVSITLDYSGNPHIAYFDATYMEGGLKYARWDGLNWRIEFIDDNKDHSGVSGMYPSIALDASGVPHISYWDFGLNYAYRLTPPG
jgi:hypothetical protein